MKSKDSLIFGEVVYSCKGLDDVPELRKFLFIDYTCGSHCTLMNSNADKVDLDKKSIYKTKEAAVNNYIDTKRRLCSYSVDLAEKLKASLKNKR